MNLLCNIFQTTQFWTIFGTVFSGVIVFVLSEIAMELWIKPFQKRREIKAQVAFLLSFYGDVIFSPPCDTEIEEFKKKRHDAEVELRNLSAAASCFYRRKKFRIISKDLMYLSNANNISSSSGKK